MTKLFPLLLLLLCSLFISCKQIPNHKDSINPVIGNISFIEKHGHRPLAANEDERIRAHLEYVEQLLRAKDVSQLSLALRSKRQQILALLHDYRLAGSFPKNYDHPEERRPCFIDRDGNICAVGYLVAQTAGRPLAEKINSEHQYDYIKDMRTPELGEWVAASGLTLDECAMIQPTYGWRDQREIPLGYSISTATFTGANAIFTGVNIRQSIAGKRSSTVALIGLASGVAQTTLGILENNNDVGDKYLAANKINIGLGAATIVSSIVNLVLNKQPRSKKTNVTLGSFTTMNQEQGFGFTITRKL